jgi:hypothetical protein
MTNDESGGVSVEKVMVEMSGNLVPQIKTRGQFRALCKALGIEVKEATDPLGPLTQYRLKSCHEEY